MELQHESFNELNKAQYSTCSFPIKEYSNGISSTNHNRGSVGTQHTHILKRENNVEMKTKHTWKIVANSFNSNLKKPVFRVFGICEEFPEVLILNSFF